MVSRTESKSLYEFDDFLVDPVRRVLLRAGEPVPVTPKSMSILLALLERPGQVVAKTELLDRVWPGVIVTEANLTQNVFSLRKSLGERANDTRYIQTVPGEGYSFAGEVRRLERAVTGEIPIVEDLPEATAAPPAAAPAAAPAPAVPVPLKASARWWRPLAAVGLALALAMVSAFGFTRLRGQGGVGGGGEDGSGARLSVAVLDFENLTPKAELAWMEIALAEMLTTELAAGGRMRVIRGERVAQAIKSLSLTGPGRLQREDLKKLHEALGADLVVTGKFLPIKDQIRVDLRVLTLPEGEIKASLAQVGTQPALFELVARTGVGLRDALGIEALSPRQAREAQALRPGNKEAARLYLEGLARLRSYDPPGALPLLRQAAAADPSSAVIHAALSRAWANLGYDARASEEAHKAVDLSRPLSQEDQLAAQARFFQVSKAWDKASQTYRALWTFFPDDVDYGLQLAECQLMGGYNKDAAATLATLRRLPLPAGEDPRIDLLDARNSRRLFDFVAQKRAAESAGEKGRRSGQWLVVSQACVYEGDALLQTGKPREALVLFQEARALAAKAEYKWGVGQALANIAASLQALGDLAGAERMNRESLKIAEELGNAVGIAAQLSILGTLAQERGELDEALALFDSSLRWYEELGDRVMQVRVLNSAGLALTSQGELAAARERFERSLDLTHALGHRAYEARTLDCLGAVLALQGKLGEARRHHEKAFAILSQLDDPGLASSALAAAAEAQAWLGEPAGAWERSATALETKRRIGDRLGAGRVLASRARIAYARGELAASRALAEEQRRIAQEAGAKPLAALAFQILGSAAFATGDLEQARRLLEKSLETSLAMGEAVRAAQVRLELASLALAGNRAGEAALLARESAIWFRARQMSGDEACALSVLAAALSRQGLDAPAREAAGQARARLAATEDRGIRLAVTIRLARLDAAGGKPEEAVQALRQASDEAMRLGLAATELEARLALGEVQRSLGDPMAGAILVAVRRDAEARGFKRLALQAGEPAVDPAAVKAAR